MYLPATTLSLTAGGGLSGFKKGLGDCGCGGSCGTCVGQVQGDSLCSYPGMGHYGTPYSSYGTGLLGLGLFDSMDFTTWGAGEWGVVIVGGYLLLKLFSDIGRGGRAVRKGIRKRRARKAKRKKLGQELASL